MKTISQLLLTFLLNAGWQVALITTAAALCAWLLRGICTCRVSEDEDYCSPHCEAADGSEMTAVVCECGHSNCGAEMPA